MAVSGVSDAKYAQVLNAEKEANQRVAAAGKQVEAAQLQTNESLNQIRDAYEREATQQGARNEIALQNQQIKGYEQVRDLQKGQQADLRRLRRDGERETAKLQEHYRNTTFATERDAKEVLNNIQKQNAHQIEYAQKSHRTEAEDESSSHQLRMNQLRDHSDQQLQRLHKEAHTQYEKMKEGYEEANHRTHENFENQYKTIQQQASETLEDVQGRASQQLRAIREDTSQKLTAYASRQRDPFYGLMDINARIRETSDSYVLTATIPEYEQQHVSVSIKGDNIVISGKRRSEENLELGPGHTVGSESYQSYHESFPLSWPVDSSRLSKAFDGDLLIARVPKRNQYAFKMPTPPKPEKLKADAPHFPENIRHAKPESTAKDQEPRHSSPKTKGSGVLS